MNPVISGYSSSDDDGQVTPNIVQKLPLRIVEIAPSSNIQPISTAVSISKYNQNRQIEQEVIDDQTFELERRSYDNKRSRGDNKKRKRAKKGKSDDVDGYRGPWARYESSEDELVEEEEEQEQEALEQVSTSDSEEEPENEEATEFLGTEEHDYQGRTYMAPPAGLSKPEECFIPKKLIHKYKGHQKGTNKIELFPKTGHLLLSCGNDSKIYLWSTHGKRELLRGFYGHKKPIRDISFNNDGTRFLSSSYDKTVKLWNTETGECLKRFRLKSVANVVKFNPYSDNEFIVGLINHKIQHYDIEKDDPIQTYDHHLGSINSITFLPNQKRFISSSEDKTIRIWDISINIPVKLISDPKLHSMPVIKIHPEGNYFAAQSMDNSILVFSTKERYKTNKKKLFNGHNCAGYGIGIDFSPDGKELISGDSSGLLFVWDWKTCKLIKKLKIDSKSITQVLWNQMEVSKVLMTGPSGVIYYYE